MDRRFTARLADGTESRVAWVLWVLGAYIASDALLRVVIFADVFVDTLRYLSASSWLAFVVDAVIGLVDAAVVAFVVLLCVRFAVRRLIMPREAWLAIAAPHALASLAVVLSLPSGYTSLVFVVVGCGAGVAAAWLIERRDLNREPAGFRPERELA